MTISKRDISAFSKPQYDKPPLSLRALQRNAWQSIIKNHKKAFFGSLRLWIATRNQLRSQ